MEDKKIFKCKLIVEKILWKSSETDYKIFRARFVEGYEEYPSPSHEVFYVKGICAKLVLGKAIYIMEAEEIFEAKYGLTYKLIWLKEDIDVENLDSQKIFLNSILSERSCEALFARFDNPLKALKEGREADLLDIPGIGPATIAKIKARVLENEDYGSFIMKVGFEVAPTVVRTLIKKYGSSDLAVQKIQENPYILTEVKGIGFKKADEIAQKSGITKSDPRRIKAFIRFVLEDTQEKDGHLWLSLSDLVCKTRSDIDVQISIPEVVGCIKQLIKENILHYDEKNKIIGLESYFQLEKHICKEIIRLLNVKMEYPEDWREKVKALEESQGWEFNEEQLLAIETSLKNPVTIITGPGGVGKTSVVAGILYALPGIDFGQCALSGKAANRLTEVTNFEGMTIHRLLGFKGGKFFYNKDNPLYYDMELLDESSMVGGDIYYRFLSAIKTGDRLIMLGDVNQLDAIGIGATFKDFIASGVIPVVRLTKIMRQAAKSGIITTSLEVSKGNQITDTSFNDKKIIGELKDFELDCTDGEIFLKLKEAYNRFIKKASSIMELQFITPMRERGSICTKNINTFIQNLYNPPSFEKAEITLTKGQNSYILREGDKVINRKNNYRVKNIYDEDASIYNGNIGIIEAIEYGHMIINFESIGRIIITSDLYTNIELAYCITCHLAQGSQYEYVVYCFDMNAYVLLNKEQIYTGISRAKYFCLMICPNKALQYAIRTSKSIIKHTWLKKLLEEN